MSAKQPIPEQALDDRHAFIGMTGSGKTYNAGGAVERLMAAGRRVVIIDPLDVWWGLRLAPDGKTPSDFRPAIIGGAHGDLPLNEHAGKLIGETVATTSESCIVALSDLPSKAAERRFMIAFLDALYRKANGEPVHLIFDEADLWAPQKGGEPQLQSLMESIVRRGRVKGLISWLITQRPAVLSKDVLSQVDGLIAFKLTASQDREALGAWIEGAADRATGREILATLPTMQQGQGVVWIPGRGILDTVFFPPKLTFDSSRSPKRGEKKRTANLVPLDVPALKERLATVEADLKANDPANLKAEIARLKGELRKVPTAQPGSGQPASAVAMAVAEERGYARGQKDAATQIKAAFHAAAKNPDGARVLESGGTFMKTLTPAERVAGWNAKHPIGTPVTRYKLLNPLREGTETLTRSQAWVLSGHTPVVMIEGVTGCVLLDSVVVSAEAQEQPERALRVVLNHIRARQTDIRVIQDRFSQEVALESRDVMRRRHDELEALADFINRIRFCYAGLRTLGSEATVAAEQPSTQGGR